MVLQKRHCSILIGTLLGVIIFSFSCDHLKSENKQLSFNDSYRIISLAPSITETLFSLNLGSQVIGVTNFCKYPDATKDIEKLGNYVEPNLEKIIYLKPDLVILLKDHDKAKQFLLRHNLPFLAIENHSIAQLCSSFVAIGRVCQREQKADSLIQLFASYMDEKSHFSQVPKILICVGRNDPGCGIIRNVFVAGKSTFYGDLINLVGGKNCYDKRKPVYPNLSREGVIALAPDIIIDIAPAMRSVACADLAKDWDELSIVPAVKNNQVYCLSQSYTTIPGPRISWLLEDMRDIVKNHVRTNNGSEKLSMNKP